MGKVPFQLFLLTLIFCLNCLRAQTGIQFNNDGFTAALSQAEAQKKPLFLMCYATWCPHCKNMKEKVLLNSEVSAFYNANFICIEQDMEAEGSEQIHQLFSVKSFPTFIYLDPQGKLIYQISGEFKVPEFIFEGKCALTPERQLPYLKSQWEADISNSENCYTYIRALKKGGLEYKDLVKKYFATQTEDQLLSEVNWRILSNGLTDFNSREIQYVIKHQEDFVKITSRERVDAKIFQVVKKLLIPLVESNDTVSYFTNRTKAAAIHLYKTDSLIFSCDLRIYEHAAKWDAYHQTALKSADTFLSKDFMQLRSIAKTYLENITDKVALKFAVQLAQQSLLVQEEYATYLLIARLQEKAENKTAAKQSVMNAISFAAQFGWDHYDADQLLLNLGKKQ